MDTLSAASCLQIIASKSKSQLIRCLLQLDTTDLTAILFAFLSLHQPTIKSIIDKNWNYSTIETAKHIQNIFLPTTTSQNVVNCKLLSLPSMLGGYIVSFFNMYDRLSFESVSKDCNKWCQIPLAKTDLIIDAKFSENMIYNKINKMKYGSKKISHLNLKFIYSAHYAKTDNFIQFQPKYYSDVNDILIGSTIKSFTYALTHSYAQNTFNRKSLKENEMYQYGQHGTIVDWMMKWHREFFNHVETLNWTPSIHANSWNSGNPEYLVYLMKHYFVKCLPNLRTLIIPELYGQNEAVLKKFGGWFLFSENFYWNQLEILEINLLNVGDIIDIKQHPLWYIHKFTQLQKLTLTIPVNARYCACLAYYKNFWSREHGDLALNNLTDISLKFCEVDDTWEHGRGKMPEQEPMKNICTYVLSFCPNLMHYTFLGNQSFIWPGFNYKHLIGHTDKLQTLNINHCDFFKFGINMLSLKVITFNVNSKQLFDTFMEDFNNFKYTPYLESFKCIYDIDSITVNDEWNKNIIQFLRYFSKQKSIGNLHHIHLINQCDKTQSTKVKCMESDLSKEICKLIISLNVCNDNNIECIELSPLTLKQREFDYLKFWYGDEFGMIDSKIHSKKRNTYFMDIKMITTT